MTSLVKFRWESGAQSEIFMSLAPSETSLGNRVLFVLGAKGLLVVVDNFSNLFGAIERRGAGYDWLILGPWNEFQNVLLRNIVIHVIGTKSDFRPKNEKKQEKVRKRIQMLRFNVTRHCGAHTPWIVITT